MCSGLAIQQDDKVAQSRNEGKHASLSRILLSSSSVVRSFGLEG